MLVSTKHMVPEQAGYQGTWCYPLRLISACGVGRSRSWSPASNSIGDRREASAEVEYDLGTRWDAASEVLDQWGFGAPGWEGAAFPIFI